MISKWMASVAATPLSLARSASGACCNHFQRVEPATFLDTPACFSRLQAQTTEVIIEAQHAWMNLVMIGHREVSSLHRFDRGFAERDDCCAASDLLCKARHVVGPEP